METLSMRSYMGVVFSSIKTSPTRSHMCPKIEAKLIPNRSKWFYEGGGEAWTEKNKLPSNSQGGWGATDNGKQAPMVNWELMKKKKQETIFGVSPVEITEIYEQKTELEREGKWNNRGSKESNKNPAETSADADRCIEADDVVVDLMRQSTEAGLQRWFFFGVQIWKVRL